MKLRGMIGLFAAAVAAQAHFLFVVPEWGGKKAAVVLTEDLVPGSDAGADYVAGAKLSLRGADGKDAPLEMVKGEKSYEVTLAGSGVRVVHGRKDLGWRQMGTGKPHLLLYYPKTVLGDPSGVAVGGATPLEIVAHGSAGALQLELLAHGKPAPNAEITVILEGGKQRKVKTDASGRTAPLAVAGRIGAWARYWETEPGERDGKKYEELRHYATFLADVYGKATRVAALPQAASSFGAVESDGWLYVYGGHVSPTHTYWSESVSGRFHRMKVSTGQWEELPGGEGLQGMNLVAHGGKIYRIGGMAPRNAKGKAPDNHSVASCRRFDPAAGTWEDLPALPEARSSHDAVAIGNQIIVAGGWNMKGSSQKWFDTMLVLDLSKQPLQWESRPQPFVRRALIAAAWEDKMYVIGGIDPQGKVTGSVAVYDPRTAQWSEGPALPDVPMAGFSPAAAVYEGKLFVSIADGSLLRLDAPAKAWRKVAEATARVAHRMAPGGKQLLVLGGASRGNNLDAVECWTPEGGM